MTMTSLACSPQTLDKFIGDAVMAVFGVPTVRENDSFRACRCALRMMQRLDDFNAEFRAANEGRYYPLPLASSPSSTSHQEIFLLKY
eukprot:SAG11_NODE_7_length_31267_cov_19.541966_26_plen_87_part_00